MAALPNSVLERPLPKNLDAERCVIGAILQENSYLNAVIEKGLKAEDFFLDQHRLMFETMLEMSEMNTPPDPLTLPEFLSRKGKLEAAGGIAYVAGITDGVPRIINVEHYARIVKEKSLLRSLAHATNAIQQRAIAGEEDADALLDQAESQLFELAESRVRAGFVGVKELVQENFARLEQIFTEGRNITGLSTGYAKLDERTSGLQPSELIILAARPSMGKTALALNLAQNIAVNHRESVAVFSLEMSKPQIVLRMLSSEARVDSHGLRTGKLQKEDWWRLAEAAGRLEQAPIYIDDTGGITVQQMRGKARRLKAEKGLDLLIVDYLQLMQGRSDSESRQQEISDISRSLKALAKELNVPVVALSQLSRAVEARKPPVPMLADLRESGAIEQDADVVMFIYREDVYDQNSERKGIAEIIISKHRNGPIGKRDLFFHDRFAKFESLDVRES